ncbi:MAG TPA: response regulator transcription factor [Terriglobales bacterium]|nr:response regulator transcription factor [Terriglobales bacterium]
MSRLLIVEDEAHLADGLRFNLEAEGHSAEVVSTGEAALEKLLSHANPYDAVVLDVMLPGIDGFQVVTELRRANQYLPVLMLTARGRPEDVLKGFESGADDYLPKPFELAILMARIHGLLRRSDWTRNHAPRPAASENREAAPANDVVSFNGKTVDFRSLELRAAGRTIHLTMMEADLLRHLIRNNGQVVSRRSLLEDVWGLREDTDTRAIDNFIVRLRRYIEREPARPRHLLTVRGVGYKFILEPAAEEKKARLSRWRA